MNFRLRRQLLSFCGIAAAFGAGLLVRAGMRPAPVGVPGMAGLVVPAALPSQFPEPAAVPMLSHEPPEGLASLRDGLNRSWGSANPFRDQAAAMLRILRGAKTPDDFAAALAIIADQPEDGSADEHYVVPLTKILFERWAVADPAAALLATQQIKGRQSSNQTLSAVTKLWAARDAPGALGFILTLKAPLRNSAVHALSQEIGRSDPALAMSMAQQTEAQGIRMDMVGQVLSPWSGRDPAAAMQWVMTQGGEKRYSLLESCLQGLASNRGFAGTIEAITALEIPGKERDQLLARLLDTGFVWPDNPDTALRGIAAIRDDEIRRRAIQQLASLSNYPDAQTEALISGLPEGADRQAFLHGHARDSIISGENFNPVAALERIGRVESGEAQDEQWRELGGRWGGRDPAAASKWLAAEPAGARRDTVAGEFVRSLVRTDPEAALLWSASISDPGKRLRRLNELLPQWAAKDSAAASAWVESAEALGEEDRDALRKVLD